MPKIDVAQLNQDKERERERREQGK